MNTEYTLTAAGKSFKLKENESPRGLRNGDRRPDELWIYTDQGFNRIQLLKHIHYLNELAKAMEHQKVNCQYCNDYKKILIKHTSPKYLDTLVDCPNCNNQDPDIIQQQDGTVDAIAKDLEDTVTNAVVRHWETVKGL